MNKLLRRVWASTGGAVMMMLIYAFTICILYVYKYNFYEMPQQLSYVIAPAQLFVGIEPGTFILLGLPITTLVISLLIYMLIGYLIDWVYKPYE